MCWFGQIVSVKWHPHEFQKSGFPSTILHCLDRISVFTSAVNGFNFVFKIVIYHYLEVIGTFALSRAGVRFVFVVKHGRLRGREPSPPMDMNRLMLGY